LKIDEKREMPIALVNTWLYFLEIKTAYFQNKFWKSNLEINFGNNLEIKIWKSSKFSTGYAKFCFFSKKSQFWLM